MEFSISDAVGLSSAVSDRDARPQKWRINTKEGDYEDYASLFREFMDKLLANKGSFKVDGSLLFEFVPKAYMTTERLISADTSYYFHRMAEGVVYTSENIEANDNYADSAIEQYQYQKKVPPLDSGYIDSLAYGI